MARIRTLKPEAFQSETLGEVSVSAERTFFGMSTQADDRGRLPDKAAVINGALWPMRPHHTVADLEAELVELAHAGLICRYTGCDGKRYLHLVTWDSHHKIERPSRSRNPMCWRHPVGSEGFVEYCGKHKGDCQILGEGSPNPHRGLTEPSVRVRGVLGEPSPSGPKTVDRGPKTVDPKTLLSAASQPTASDKPDDQPETGPAPPDDADADDQPPLTVDDPVPPDLPPATAHRRKAAEATTDDRFDEFWTAYPRKIAKPAAVKAWTKATKNGANPDAVIAAAARYATTRAGEDPRYTAHPATWLNNERWNDQPADTTPPGDDPPPSVVADEIAHLRTGPPCEHGDPGGNSPHPVHGTPLCPKCRRGIPAPRDDPNPVDTYRRLYTAQHGQPPPQPLMTTVGRQRQDLNQHGMNDTDVTRLAAAAAVTGHDLAQQLQTERDHGRSRTVV